MPRTFWYDYIVEPRSDGTADIYAWNSEKDSYEWLGDYASTDEAEHYVREMQTLPEFPEIKPISTHVRLPHAEE